MPNVSYQWSAYTYHLFQTVPLYLSLLSLLGSAMATVGSTVYARYVAPADLGIRTVFIVVTLLSTAVSLLYLVPA